VKARELLLAFTEFASNCERKIIVCRHRGVPEEPIKPWIKVDDRAIASQPRSSGTNLEVLADLWSVCYGALDLAPGASAAQLRDA
jgi:hypothetical protein